ncbi:MAG: hypothetical protein ACLGIA_00630 [Actinomycetes bacterium]
MSGVEDAFSQIRAEIAAAEAAEAAAPTAQWEKAPAGEEAGRVYSLRIPGNRLLQLRDVAQALGKKQSTLLREWILERLDQEQRRLQECLPAVPTAEGQPARARSPIAVGITSTPQVKILGHPELTGHARLPAVGSRFGQLAPAAQAVGTSPAPTSTNLEQTVRSATEAIETSFSVMKYRG